MKMQNSMLAMDIGCRIYDLQTYLICSNWRFCELTSTRILPKHEWKHIHTDPTAGESPSHMLHPLRRPTQMPRSATMLQLGRDVIKYISARTSLFSVWQSWAVILAIPSGTKTRCSLRIEAAKAVMGIWFTFGVTIPCDTPFYGKFALI